MLAFFGELAASLGRGVTVAGVVMLMALICVAAVLFTFAMAPPTNRRRVNARRRPGKDTRALLRR